MKVLINLIGSIIYVITYMVTRSSFVNLQSQIRLPNFNEVYIASLFSLIYALGQIPCGMFIDKYGVKKAGLTLTSIMCMGLVVCLFAPTGNVFLLGRCITAIGCTGGMLLTIKSLQEQIDVKYFTTFIGAIMSLALFFNIISVRLCAIGWKNFFVLKIILVIISGFFLFLYKKPQDLSEGKININSENLANEPSINLSIFQLVSILLRKGIIPLAFMSCITYYGLVETSYISYWIVENGILKNPLLFYELAFLGFMFGGLIASFIEKALGAKMACVFNNAIAVLSIGTLFLYPAPSTLLMAACLLGYTCSIQYFFLTITREYVPSKYMGTCGGIINLFSMVSAPVAQILLGKIGATKSSNDFVVIFGIFSALMALLISLFLVMKPKKPYTA